MTKLKMTKHHRPVSSRQPIPQEVLERVIKLTEATPGLELIDPSAFPRKGVMEYTVEKLESGDYRVSRGVNGSQQIVGSSIQESELVSAIWEDAYAQEVMPKVTYEESDPTLNSSSRWWMRVTQPGEYRCLEVNFNGEPLGVLFPSRFVLNPSYLQRGRTPLPSIKPIVAEIKSVYSSSRTLEGMTETFINVGL